MDAAIRHVLSERDFRAGDYSVGYQVCNQATQAAWPINDAVSKTRPTTPSTLA